MKKIFIAALALLITGAFSQTLFASDEGVFSKKYPVFLQIEPVFGYTQGHESSKAKFVTLGSTIVEKELSFDILSPVYGVNFKIGTFLSGEPYKGKDVITVQLLKENTTGSSDMSEKVFDAVASDSYKISSRHSVLRSAQNIYVDYMHNFWVGDTFAFGPVVAFSHYKNSFSVKGCRIGGVVGGIPVSGVCPANPESYASGIYMDIPYVGFGMYMTGGEKSRVNFNMKALFSNWVSATTEVTYYYPWINAVGPPYYYEKIKSRDSGQSFRGMVDLNISVTKRISMGLSGTYLYYDGSGRHDLYSSTVSPANVTFWQSARGTLDHESLTALFKLSYMLY